MQIMFAAPFLLAAGLVFTILSLISPARRWGIPVPTGILAAAPSLIVALLIVSLLAHWFAPTRDWQGWWAGSWLGIAGAAALLGGVIAGVAALLAACALPALLLRAAVFIAAWCSYFVLVVASEIAGSHLGLPRGNPLETLGLEFLLSFICAFFIAKRSEGFRPREMRLPWDTTIAIRARARRGSLEKLKAILDRVPDVPPAPEDRI
jgi:hypothetical protein